MGRKESNQTNKQKHSVSFKIRTSTKVQDFFLDIELSLMYNKRVVALISANIQGSSWDLTVGRSDYFRESPTSP